MKQLLTILATVLIATPVHAREALREESRVSRPAAGLTGIRVDNASGLIEVAASRDGAVHVTALKLVRTDSESRRVELARATRVEVTDSGGQYRVRVVYPQRQSVRIGLWDLIRGVSVDFPEVEVRLSLEVPGRLPVIVRSASGDVITRELAGPQSVESTSGDVEVRAAAGVVSASSTSGDVSIERAASGVAVASVSGDVSADGVAGPLRARTTSGDLSVHGARDSIHVSTVSGDLEVVGAPRGLLAVTTSGTLTVDGPLAGSVRIETTNGDVVARLSAGVRRAEVSSVSGTLRIEIDERLAADLDLRTVSGSLDVSLPIDLSETSRMRVRGTVRGGGVPVVLRSSSGDIDVVSGGN